MSKEKSNKEVVIVKARYWWFVLYPESAPADWLDFLQMTGLPFAVSPLHENDINADGEPKKPHYHVIICYNGPTTFSNVKKTITEPLNQPHPQYLASVKGAYRYLYHADNPEKFQYDPKEVRLFGGFNIEDYAAMTLSDEDRLFDAIEDIIFKNKILEYWNLNIYLRQNALFELLSFLRRHTYHFKELLTSLRNSGAFSCESPVLSNIETGEVMPKPKP